MVFLNSRKAFVSAVEEILHNFKTKMYLFFNEVKETKIQLLAISTKRRKKFERILFLNIVYYSKKQLKLKIQ